MATALGLLLYVIAPALVGYLVRGRATWVTAVVSGTLVTPVILVVIDTLALIKETTHIAYPLALVFGTVTALASAICGAALARRRLASRAQAPEIEPP